MLFFICFSFLLLVVLLDCRSAMDFGYELINWYFEINKKLHIQAICLVLGLLFVQLTCKLVNFEIF